MQTGRANGFHLVFLSDMGSGGNIYMIENTFLSAKISLKETLALYGESKTRFHLLSTLKIHVNSV